MLLLLCAACLDAPEPAPARCNTCHGDAEGMGTTSWSPPFALGDIDEVAYAGVGAHQAHVLAPSMISRPVECSECHVVPSSVDAPGHIDTCWPAEVRWGALAKTGSIAPTWDRDNLTCSNTYCHGATVTGGQVGAPVWTMLDGTQLACGACHGFPPPTPIHARGGPCEDCHPTPSQDPSRHIDGTVDFN